MSDELMNKIKDKYTREDIDDIDRFDVGDTIKVWATIGEGNDDRLQPFQGIVINKRRGGTDATFTVRKLSGNVGVEKVFPFNSLSVKKIEVIKKGKVNRAKLYYLRERVGKKAKVKEKRATTTNRSSTE